jgi:hypothetical protein
MKFARAITQELGDARSQVSDGKRLCLLCFGDHLDLFRPSPLD